MNERFLMRLSLLLLTCGLCTLLVTAQQAEKSAASGTDSAGKESVRGLVSKRHLEPPLQSDIKYLRFSPNGKYIIAQDEGGINVLARDPFAIIFHIEAPNSSLAQFTPDSQSVVFYQSKLQVQLWSIAERKLKSRQAVMVNQTCWQTQLSPDGKTVACFDIDNSLTLFDVATSAQIFRQEDFYTAPVKAGSIIDDISLLNVFDKPVGRINMAFSPDGRYFAAGVVRYREMDLLGTDSTVLDASKGAAQYQSTADPNEISRPEINVFRPDRVIEGTKAIAFDLTSRKQVTPGGALKNLLAGGFTFITGEQVVGIDPKDKTKSALVTFPAGETVKPLSLSDGSPDAPGHGNYVLVRPFQGYSVGVLSLADNKLFMASKRKAMDIYDDVFVAEVTSGELGLYGAEKKDLRARVSVPGGFLGPLYALALSPDFKWLALSTETRGAVWNLETGERVFNLRGFWGAYFAEDGAFYVDFPAQGEVKRTIGVMQPQQRDVRNGELAEVPKSIRPQQYGRYFTFLRPSDKERPVKLGEIQGYSLKDTSLEVRDVRTMMPLWTKAFKGAAPEVWVDPLDDTVTLEWQATNEALKAELKGDATLNTRFSAIKEREGVSLLQVLDARTGQPQGRLLIDRGKDAPATSQILAAGDRVIVADWRKRVLVYSLTSGEQIGQVIASQLTVSKSSGLLCVESTAGQLAIYDLATMQQRTSYSFSNTVACARFSEDGKRLFVLTRSQDAYVLDVSLPGAASKSVD